MIQIIFHKWGFLVAMRTCRSSFTRLHDRKSQRTRSLFIDIAIRTCFWATQRSIVSLTEQAGAHSVLCQYIGWFNPWKFRSIQRTNWGYRGASAILFQGQWAHRGYTRCAARLCCVECGNYDAIHRFLKTIGKSSVFRTGRLSFNVEVNASLRAIKADR